MYLTDVILYTLKLEETHFEGMTKENRYHKDLFKDIIALLTKYDPDFKTLKIVDHTMLYTIKTLLRMILSNLL